MKIFKLFADGKLVLNTPSWALLFKTANSLITKQEIRAFFVLKFDFSDLENNVLLTMPAPETVEYDEAMIPISHTDGDKKEVKSVIHFKKETQSFFGYDYVYWTNKTPILHWVYPDIRSLF